jgi:hypothetical protein
MTADTRTAVIPPPWVPYITQWSHEQTSDVPVLYRRRGIAYPDERPRDRDDHGVLWTRVSSKPGQGRPQFGKVHARRQRRAMTKLLCQVCGQPADRNNDGILWLIGEDPRRPGTWPDPLYTVHPPVCAECAVRSVRTCPHLRRQCTALRVSAFDLTGVRGVLYAQGFPGIGAIVGVAYDDPRIRWVRAGQLIVHLRDYTITNPDTASGNVTPGQMQSPA